jgi:heme A synthase
MRSAYKWIAYLLAAEVLVQAMAIAYALAGLGHWVEEDGGVLNKALIDSDNADFGGVTGFMIHGMNGMMIIPLLVLILLIVSFFTKMEGAVKRAAILLGLVVLQVVLGITSHSLPFAIVFHALNAFAIFSMAALTGYRTATSASSTAYTQPQATATV